jgi:hypothetical protein
MPRLQRLINESLHVIREALARYGRLAVLWSMGKDWDVERPHADRAGPVERSRLAATARRNRAVNRQPPGRLLPVRPRALQRPWTGPAVAGPPPTGRLACRQALAYRAPSGLWPMGAAHPGRWPGLRDYRTFGAEATPWWAQRASERDRGACHGLPGGRLPRRIRPEDPDPGGAVGL